MVNLTNKRICVTGGAGFVGSHLCEELVKGSNEVKVIDNFTYGSMENLESINDSIEIINADIRDISQIKAHLENCEIVYHLAAIANPKKCNKDIEETYRVNIEGTKNVISCCKNTERLIFSSSITVYGGNFKSPIDESNPLMSTYSYSLAKQIGECLLRAYNSTTGIPFTILRNCNIYGPRQAIDYLIPSLIDQGNKDGFIEVWDPHPVRDFVYVTDAVSAFMEVASSESCINKSFNMGTGIGTSIGNVVKIISESLGIEWKDANKPQDVSPFLVANNEHLCKSSSWRSLIGIREGIQNTIESVS